MADDLGISSDMDLSKLKVHDLKRELKSRGLNTSGNKNELVERLQTALKSTDSRGERLVDELEEEDLLNEEEEFDDAHLETTESVISDIDTAEDTALNDSLLQTSLELEKKEKRKLDDSADKAAPAPKKVVLNRNTPIIAEQRISTESNEGSDKNGTSTSDSEEKKVIKLTGVTAKERLEMRAKKFDVTLSAEARKLARAERFGGSVASKSNSDSGIKTKVNTSVDVLKQRAERFGGSVSKIMSQVDAQERLEKRKARFGIVTPTDKAKQRQERFKEPVK